MENATTMSKCWCRFVLAILVIVFAWWGVSWGRIALTVLGVILAYLALDGRCCCASIKSSKTECPTCQDDKPQP